MPDSFLRILSLQKKGGCSEELGAAIDPLFPAIRAQIRRSYRLELEGDDFFREVFLAVGERLYK